MDHNAMKELTRRAMANPEVGDTFSEMLSYWVHVVKRTPRRVGYFETLKGEWKYRCVSPETFEKRFRYDTIPGYWISFMFNRSGFHGLEAP